MRKPWRRQSGFSWSKSNTSSGAVMHISIFRFIFLVENLRYSAPGPCWHEMAAWRRDTGVIRSSDMRIPDLRCPGPGAGSWVSTRNFWVVNKIFHEQSSDPPTSSETTFHFRSFDMTLAVITIAISCCEKYDCLAILRSISFLDSALYQMESSWSFNYVIL